ncbi:MAG: hypothetical protein RR619_10340, partial [Raoultibacter sp.]
MQTDETTPPKTDVMIANEKQHLREVLNKVRDAIAHARRLVDRTEDNYQDMKSYMSGYRGEIDPSEQYQNELHLHDVDRQSAEAAEAKGRLEKLLDSPYFARIDFVEHGEASVNVIYIGRFSFNYESQSVISDWRSPVAALFYDFDSGEASYVAPAGLMRGTLIGKRQLEIQGGELKYAVDSGSSVRDEVLQHELSKTSDQKMKSIISSIQREQNSIIRDERSGSLIIQGVAGSGKTSIALHRVAYLLYRHKDTLTSNSVAILSPNKVFGDYISTVLPELGEEPIKELYLEDLFEQVLGSSLAIEPPRSFVDTADEAWASRARYKGSAEFAEQVRCYLDETMASLLTGESLVFGRHSVDGSWIEKRFYSYENMSVADRIESVASDIVLDLTAQFFKIGAHAMPTKGAVRAQLVRMLQAKDALALYRRFFADTKRKDQFKLVKKGVIEW